jgi:RNA polymerase sigma factor (sigma-70 family)
MEDERIVALYWARDEAALEETKTKYNPYLLAVAQNIVGSREDSEECVNDAYLGAWNSIPPQQPRILSAYLAKLTRRAAIDRVRQAHRSKRIPRDCLSSLSELEMCIPAADTVETACDAAHLAAAINAYLHSLAAQQRQVFVSRYWYALSIREIAACFSLKESNVKMVLLRTRNGLRDYLEKEGVFL